jgi:hypothetical protein
MHEFCCCEALKVFKIIYEKVVKRRKRFSLKGFENLFKKDLKKKENPNPFPIRPDPTPLSFFPVGPPNSPGPA